MKAVICRKFGELAVDEVPAPTAGPGQVVLAVRACGVNFPDTLIVAGKYQFKPEPPFSPGGEIAGVIEQVGEGVTHIKVGDRVAAMTIYGGYAEKIAVGAAQVIPLPDGLDFPEAACSLVTYGTTWHALADRAQLRAGEWLLVLGAAGGVGLAAVEMGKQLGARVIAAASSAAKLELCRQYGADAGIDYSREDLKQRTKEITGGGGADVVYDPVGGPYTEPALRAAAWTGRHLVIGFAAGEIPKIPANLFLLKGAAMMGVFFGQFMMREPAQARAQLVDLLGQIRDGKLRPHISARYPLAEAARALDDIVARRAQGKIVLLP